MWQYRAEKQTGVEDKMKYKTINELEHFDFKEAYIGQIQMLQGIFTMELDNVTILPENSCNRDIRRMRTNGLVFHITEPTIQLFVEEGYKVYDANGALIRQEENRTIAPEDYSAACKELEGCVIYYIERKENGYEISIDTEDHTYLIQLAGTGDSEEWDRFMNLDSM